MTLGGDFRGSYLCAVHIPSVTPLSCVYYGEVRYAEHVCDCAMVRLHYSSNESLGVYALPVVILFVAPGTGKIHNSNNFQANSKHASVIMVLIMKSGSNILPC